MAAKSGIFYLNFDGEISSEPAVEIAWVYADLRDALLDNWKLVFEGVGWAVFSYEENRTIEFRFIREVPD